MIIGSKLRYTKLSKNPNVTIPVGSVGVLVDVRDDPDGYDYRVYFYDGEDVPDRWFKYSELEVSLVENRDLIAETIGAYCRALKIHSGHHYGTGFVIILNDKEHIIPYRFNGDPVSDYLAEAIELINKHKPNAIKI